MVKVIIGQRKDKIMQDENQTPAEAGVEAATAEEGQTGEATAETPAVEAVV